MDHKEVGELDKPFRVTSTTGVFCGGHDTETAAKADADRRNEEAKDLGVETRYIVVAKP